MNPNRNIDRRDGGGPWFIDPTEYVTTDNDAEPIEAGEFVEIPFGRIEYNGRKRFFQPWLPFDVVQLKNLNQTVPVEVLLNGQFNLVIEPNAVDTFDRAQVKTVRITNMGDSDIEQGEFIVQTSVEPFGADDAALSNAKRGPIEKFVRGVFNQ